MLSTHPTAASTRAQLADTEEAILAFAVTSRQPDRDVHTDDLAWWLERQERLEIRSELAASGLTAAAGRRAITTVP